MIRTTRHLRAPAPRRLDPYTAIPVAAIALVILISAAQQYVAPLLRRPLDPIIIVATPTPSAGGAAHELMVKRPARAAAPAIGGGTAPGAAVLAAPAPTEAAPQPGGGTLAHTDQGDLLVPDDATPVPTGQPYSGPFLAPAPTDAPAGQRYCTGFGDWRDFDPMYASSPVCHQP